MKKCLIVSLLILSAATIGVQKNIVLAADLCGGTNGNGEIIRVGTNSFTLKLNDGGDKGSGNLIVNLTKRATVESPSGNVSVSDLKIGDRVTLVGDNHRNGTFTADAVVVCSGTQGNSPMITSATGEQTGQAARIMVRNNDANYRKVSSSINIATILIIGVIWINIISYFRLIKRKKLVYLLFFTIFYIYIYKVFDYTLLQFQSLLLLKHFLPNLMLNGVQAGRSVNLIPLLTLKLEDVKTSLLNILMMIPFGFGLPFITSFRFKKVVIAGLYLSIVIELLQLITGFTANITFRIADINDLIFNTLGAAIGYILFVAFGRFLIQVFHEGKMRMNPIFQYIAKRPQIN